MTFKEDVADLIEFTKRIQEDRESNKIQRVRPANTAYADEPVSESESNIPKNSQMWAIYGGNNFSACEQAVDVLPPGQYTVEHSNSLGIYFHKATTNLDELISLPDSVSEEVIKEVNKFWTLEKHFRQFGFLWKRGVLLWGPPGSGKTSTLQVVSQNIINNGGISIYVDHPSLTAKGLKILREVEPRRPLVIMLEDIDAIIDEHGESDLLALMDGELQIDNVAFIATTNYPERLDKRFINRPSRFDIVKKIGMPNEEARAVYLKTKNTKLALGENKDQLLKWVTATKGFSVAHLKELIVSVEVFGVEFDQAIMRLKTMIGDAPSSSDGEGSGFGFIPK